jgi:photosystem II stability/assembly factor-like uncharacterized protein
MGRLLLLALASGLLAPSGTGAQTKLYYGMHWRMIGPFRGGRTVGATGVPGRPNEFYIGVNNGGVWKTTDYGRVWKPVFDDQPTGSIGAVAVAPTDADRVYVGSGEGLQRPDLSTGDGIYRSDDGGKTWTHLGLRDGQQISALAVDPHDKNKVFAAVLGHPYGANTERGLFRSTDGGQTWDKVLYKDENTGAMAVVIDPTNPNVVYADLFASRQGPWENGSWQGPGSGLYKSIDGGTTWKQLTAGLPAAADGLGRIGMAIAPSLTNRLYAVVDAPKLGGMYRSDDFGEHWTRTDNEDRIWGRGSDFGEVTVDSKNPDVLYDVNTSTYKSVDGGHSFVAWKGAPGGDDYHSVWVNPSDPNTILLASDQGAVITVNGGETWSSWYNQPTAQFYHVSTDNRFPYWVYGGQQESGSAGVASRGNDGQITFREWHPVGAEEYAYVAPDPLHPNWVFGGKATRFDWATGQTQDVSPRGPYRFLRTAPLLFSPADPRILYLGANVLLKTTDSGSSWQEISPDLTREHPDVPDSIGVFKSPSLTKMPRRGVIYSVGPTPVDVNTIWVGTDDGLVHVTHDGGKSWTNVTPKGLTSWSKVAQIDAGHQDVKTAYLAVNRIRLDDQRPHLYRTHDGGKTWKEIVQGLPDNEPTNTIRQDPSKSNLLFAGTERATYVSFDDGDHWQPLRLNMPATSIRDLVIHGDDLVVGTHGRGFWILDDITPLRQIHPAAKPSITLFSPQTAVRVRNNTNTDTPLPPDEPAAQNPPAGAVLDYFLPSDAHSEVTLEIRDAQGGLVRRFRSDDEVEEPQEKELQVPYYWVRPETRLSKKAGFHRWTWDLHYTSLEQNPASLPMAAIEHDTAPESDAPWVLPGSYTVKLLVDGTTMTRALSVRMDPRVKTTALELTRQFTIAKACYEGALWADHVREAAEKLSHKSAALEQFLGVSGPTGRRRRAPTVPTLSALGAGYESLLGTVESADVAPTKTSETEFKRLGVVRQELESEWKRLKQKS